MAKQENLIKFRTRREVNIGLVVALGVLILLVINIYRYVTTPHLSLYEVREGSAGSEATAVAMILREETVYHTGQAGYLNYYYREGARVAKGEKVYSLNDSADWLDLLNLNEENSALAENDLVRLKEDIRSFCKNYSDTNFSACYDLREEFLSDYLRYRDVSMLDALTKQTPEISGTIRTVYAEQSGTVTYFSDCYDGYTKEQLTGAEFLAENRTVPERRKAVGISGIGSFAYKLVTSEKWQLIIQLNEDELKRLQKEGDIVTFRIPGDSKTYQKQYELFSAGGEHFIAVTMDRYGNDYLSERFVEVALSFATEKGLKIPRTAIVEKELYQIPERFVMAGGGKLDSLGISMEVYDEESGEIKPDYQELSPLFYENGYYYVAREDFEAERYIHSAGEDTTPERAMLYSFITKLEGVYNMNKGYAVFNRIERLTDLEDYILVKAGSSGGVSLYDHIVLDVSAVTKDVILIEGE